MESEWKDLVYIFLLEVVVLFQIVEKCFFVTHKIVELKVVMHFLIEVILPSMLEEPFLEIFESVLEFK